MFLYMYIAGVKSICGIVLKSENRKIWDRVGLFFSLHPNGTVRPVWLLEFSTYGFHQIHNTPMEITDLIYLLYSSMLTRVNILSTVACQHSSREDVPSSAPWHLITFPLLPPPPCTTLEGQATSQGAMEWAPPHQDSVQQPADRHAPTAGRPLTPL